ncbi:MAG: DMT family transporter [candidate division WOR-3 bacterium]
MEKYAGELAALGTSLCWSFGSVFFTIASRLIGSTEVNRIRLVVGMLFLMFTHWILHGMIFPINATVDHWFWFGISGIIGFTIGDTFLFRGYLLIGPRLTMLLMSLSPIFGTILAWTFLKESLKPVEVFAIAVTLLGISMVLYDKKKEGPKERSFANGILCGICASLCQALGYYASKRGLLCYDFPAISGNVIRVTFGAIFIWLIAGVQGEIRATLGKLTNRRADMSILGGAFFGPFVGVWLSLVAIQYTNIGIASTLMALPPVILIPISHLLFKENITHTSIIGTIIAITGVALIFIT